MSTPQEAIEAGARAAYPAWRDKARTAGLPAPETFDGLPLFAQDVFRDEVRPILEDARDILGAHALREAADALDSLVATAPHMHPQVADGHRLAAVRLRDRAERIDPS